ncbi:MAG TPA: TonB-dependent receptor [Vicinamibacterales bacterium]|jgi:hypothetical protein|nr:TonB-dependent receptor [Vicinamibacterales bacterium]
MQLRNARRVCTLLVLLCFALLAPAFLFAQQPPPAADASATSTIQGTVTTQTTIPLGGVIVTLNGGPDVLHIASEGDGTYKFEHLKPGRYTVTAAFESFESTTLPAVAVAGKVLNVPIDLRLAMNDTVQVFADSSQAVVPSTGTLASSEAVEKKELEEISPGGGVQSALKLIAGVIEVPGGLAIKGGRPSQAGMQLGPGMFVDASTGLSQGALPDDAVDSVTVLPNPYAVEFGRFSSGLVVIQTRRASDKWRIRLNQLDPSFIEARGTLIHPVALSSFTPRIETGGPLFGGKFTLEHSMQFQYHAHDVGSRPQSELVKSDRFSSFTRLDGKFSDHQSLVAVGGFFPTVVHDATLGTFTPPDATVDTHSGVYTGAITERSVWTSNLFSETTAEVNRYTTRVEPQGSSVMDLQPENTLGSFFNQQRRNTRTEQLVETLSGSAQTGIGLHLYKLGVDFLHTDFDGTSNSGPVLISRSPFGPDAGTLARELTFGAPTSQAIVSNDVALYAQDRLQPSTRWYLEFGARVDRDGVIDRWNLTPRVGAAILLNQSGTAVIRGGYGLFYERTPSAAGVFDEYESYTDTRYGPDGVTPLGPPVTYTHVMSPDLKTSHSGTWDLAYDQRISRMWAIHLGVIDRKGTNELLVDPVTTPTASELLLESTGQSHYREAEVGVHFTAPGKADVNATYARSKARSDLNAFTNFFDAVLQPVVGVNQYGDARADAPNRLLARWRYTPTPRWLFVGVLDWRNGLPYSQVNEYLDFVGQRDSLRFPAYFRLDIGAERRIKVIGLKPWVGIRIDNALNSWLPIDVQSNLSSPAYGTFYNNEYRRYLVQLRFE